MIVERIFISPERGAAQIECEQITAHSKMGISGDRNFGKDTHPGQNITLVEAEEIELFCATHSRQPNLSITRRNLVTRGVRLNELVNVEFVIGNVRLRSSNTGFTVADCGPTSFATGKWLAEIALK